MQLTVPPDSDGLWHLSPTDVTQFLRLEQCERYLRLRLHERSANKNFLHDFGVQKQSVPPLRSISGSRFEEEVEEAIKRHYPVTRFEPSDTGGEAKADNGDDVVRIALDLQPGDTHILFQPRLAVRAHAWLLRGDVDVLRLHRDAAGGLHVLIADIKSSATAKVEHRVQVAFYDRMLTALFSQHNVIVAQMAMGVLYRGPSTAAPSTLNGDDVESQYVAAQEHFGTRLALLEVVSDADGYRAEVDSLVTGDNSVARRLVEAPFAEVPFHLASKCDTCPYSEFCMKKSTQEDSLSLLPHIGREDKKALSQAGITTTHGLAVLKSRSDSASGLAPAPGQEQSVQKLSATWPVGPRLDELVYRAQRYRRFRGDEFPVVIDLPHQGYSSLPFTDAQQNPNLVRVFLDVQNDETQDRLYLLGALISACEDGVTVDDRRRVVVHLSDGPPVTHEQEEKLILSWVTDVITAIVELAAPDPKGEQRAPIHLIFFSDSVQQILLRALGRHAVKAFGATPLYDFITQLAAFDSPIASVLEAEIRAHKNYPMLCQSLQSVAAYLRFDWNSPVPFREIFYTRVFDFWSTLRSDEAGQSNERLWYTGRSRFSSQIPLEYAYVAWGELHQSPIEVDDKVYQGATTELLKAFQGRRLEAMELIASQFNGNERTSKRVFHLPDLHLFEEKADTLAQALIEFLVLERHAALAEWKNAHLAAPEQRTLAGATLLLRYCAEDQEPAVREQNSENLRRFEQRDEWWEENLRSLSEDEKPEMSDEQKSATRWSQEGLVVRLRVSVEGVDSTLSEVLALSEMRAGATVIVFPRYAVDSRLPAHERVDFTPTPKQLLYGTRATILSIHQHVDGQDRCATATVELRLSGATNVKNADGFVFNPKPRPFKDGGQYTIDLDPNEWLPYFCLGVVRSIQDGRRNTLYERLSGPYSPLPISVVAVQAQAQFMDGLRALEKVGAFHTLEESKVDYIARHGDAPLLLVQGPPGTGKSYATAFAVLARLQGAMAEGEPFHVYVCCKTHSATDVLLAKILEALGQLSRWRTHYPEIFREFFDDRLVDLPLYRLQPKEPSPEGIKDLPRHTPKTPKAADVIRTAPWSVVGASPGGIYRMLKDKGGNIYERDFCDLLVLDEASQMSLPEAIMAALPLKQNGRVIVVGDHRQMPPIVKHDWVREARRTFKQFQAYESLFTTALTLRPPMIKFEESFRLHAEMAAFLKREIYQHDGINYHSNSHRLFPTFGHDDPYVAAVLDSSYPLTVVVHNEDQSQKRNHFEQRLIAPILAALSDPTTYNLAAEDGVGVVVPHRAQRAILQEKVPHLVRRHPLTGEMISSAIDTVERFQGNERSAIIISATESDREFLLASSGFLLDPRRFTVALSRAKQKLILVASHNIFNVLSTDEEIFLYAQLWKNLLRRTCTQILWQGERDGHQVTVRVSPRTNSVD